jgi:hypothetical protein
MIPNFTNINLILNTLYEFSDKEFAFGFSEDLRTTWEEELLSPHEQIKQQVKNYEDLFELAEGEIIHNVLAGNKIIINSLFDQIKSHRNYIYPKPEVLLGKIKTWNNETYKEYENKIEEKSSRYFSNDKFVGLKHLDTFEDYVPESLFSLRNFRHVTRTYYAFYCVEDKWKDFFDPCHFDKYYAFLVERIDKLVILFDKYIERYDAGEFIQKEQVQPENPEEEKTKFEKAKRWAENNKIIVTIIILVAITPIIVSQWENMQKIMGWIKPTGKDLSGIVTDEAKNKLEGVCVIFSNDLIKKDTTDSFGNFHFSELHGKGIKMEIIRLSRIGYSDTSFMVKVDYASDDKLKPLEIVLNVKSDLDLCIAGDVEACYRYANSIAKSCPANEGQSRTACIFKAEMWRAVGDDYQNILNLKKDSGEVSYVYKEAVHVWKHHIEMANAMPEW